MKTYSYVLMCNRLRSLLNYRVSSLIFFEKNEYLYSFVAPTQWQNYCKARGRSTKEIKEKIKTLEVKGKKNQRFYLSSL